MNLNNALEIFNLVCFLLSIVYAAYLNYKKLPPAEQHDYAKSIIRSVVMAVEQRCGQMDGPGKKSEAVRVASQLLGNAGVKIDPALLDTLIEQAVLMIKTGQDLQSTSLVPSVKVQ